MAVKLKIAKPAPTRKVSVRVKSNIPKVKHFITDADGKATDVVVDLKDYKKLLSRIEDMEDALALQKAKNTESSFTPAGEVFARIKTKKKKG